MRIKNRMFLLNERKSPWICSQSHATGTTEAAPASVEVPVEILEPVLGTAEIATAAVAAPQNNDSLESFADWLPLIFTVAVLISFGAVLVIAVYAIRKMSDSIPKDSAQALYDVAGRYADYVEQSFAKLIDAAKETPTPIDDTGLLIAKVPLDALLQEIRRRGGQVCRDRRLFRRVRGGGGPEPVPQPLEPGFDPAQFDLGGQQAGVAALAGLVGRTGHLLRLVRHVEVARDGFDRPGQIGQLDPGGDPQPGMSGFCRSEPGEQFGGLFPFFISVMGRLPRFMGAALTIAYGVFLYTGFMG